MTVGIVGLFHAMMLLGMQQQLTVALVVQGTGHPLMCLLSIQGSFVGYPSFLPIFEIGLVIFFLVDDMQASQCYEDEGFLYLETIVCVQLSP